jgi:ubiquinone/menaquinone biosynthesis C-methylase UbiE
MSASKSQAKPLQGDAALVGRHYDSCVDAEAARLEKYSPVEYAITLRYFSRLLPPGNTIAEVGVGTGHYAEFFARRGCTLHLVDVSEGLLQAARNRLRSCGLEQNIGSVHRASGTDLPLADASMDAVLLMGPLYHLRDPQDREQSVWEAARVLKAGGLVAAAAINRISFLRDMFRYMSDSFTKDFFDAQSQEASRTLRQDLRGQFVADFLKSGNLDPEHAPPIGYAHLTTATKFRALLTAHFEELALVGTESFTAPWQDKLASMPPEEAAGWLDIVEATGQWPEGMAYSDHFLFIGRKKS